MQSFSRVWVRIDFIVFNKWIWVEWFMTSLICSYVRTYVFHLLRTYVILLCNWLIIWQNALYLYLGRSRMCLILQETCCSSLVLKPWRLDQETSEEKLFIKTGQIARHLLDTSRHLRTDSLIPLDSWWIDRESSCLLDSSSIASW